MGNQPTSTLIIPTQSDISLSLQNGDLYNQPSSTRIGHKIITIESNEELKILKKNFDFRLRHKQFLAHLFGFEVGNNQSENTSEKNLCKFLFFQTKVTLHYEKITLKLSDLYNLSIQEGSKLLEHSLRGYSLLFDKYGYFTPEPCHIFRQGQKWVVWISDNIFSMKNDIQEKNKENSRLRSKFWQKIIHLFDVLRDEQNPEFSYSSYIYGDCSAKKGLDKLQLSEIIEKLHQISSFRNQSRQTSGLLRKSSLHSNSTIRKQEYKANLLFDERNNDATLSKFNCNKDQFTQNISKQNQYVKLSKNSLKFPSKQFVRSNQLNQRVAQIQSVQTHQKQNLVNFSRVSSQFLKPNNENQIQELKQNLLSKHIKNQSSISTLTNCTGYGNQILPIRMFGNLNQTEKNYIKRERAMTVDCSLVTNSYPQQTKLQPRKITQNSQGNSEQSENILQKDQQKQNSIQSEDQRDQVILFGPSRFVDEESSVKATSISGNTKEHGKQGMKNLQKFLNKNFKTEHKRSFTDQVVTGVQNNKIKLCLSQQFDSEFFSTCSKRQIPSTNKLLINGLASGKEIKKHINSQVNISIGNSQKRNSEKKIRKVRISDENHQVKFFKDSILQNSKIQNSSIGPKVASIDKLAVFKSQGGLKSLLGTKIGTLLSIKQIDVQVPIDEQILYDLNKMFPRHHFAKSTKMTN